MLANGFALGGAAYNRSGNPESVLAMTERELALPGRYGFKKENSGMALQINWRVLGSMQLPGVNMLPPYSTQWGTPSWLNKEKLTALGFDTSVAPDMAEAQKYYRWQIPREVFIVLEYDGQAYKRALFRAVQYLKEQENLLEKNPDGKEFISRVKAAKKYLKAEETSLSRLFAVDAGIDIGALREKYPDRARYSIVRGNVQIQTVIDNDNTWVITGRVDQISIISLIFSKDLRVPIDSILDENSQHRRNNESPRYSVKIAYGKRLEPWVIGLERIP